MNLFVTLRIHEFARYFQAEVRVQLCKLSSTRSIVQWVFIPLPVSLPNNLWPFRYLNSFPFRRQIIICSHLAWLPTVLLLRAQGKAQGKATENTVIGRMTRSNSHRFRVVCASVFLLSTLYSVEGKPA